MRLGCHISSRGSAGPWWRGYGHSRPVSPVSTPGIDWRNPTSRPGSPVVRVRRGRVTGWSPLVLWPTLPPGCPLKHLQVGLHTSSSGPSLVRRLVGAEVGDSRAACWVSRNTASRRRARLSAASLAGGCQGVVPLLTLGGAAAAAPSGLCIGVGLVIPSSP